MVVSVSVTLVPGPAHHRGLAVSGEAAREHLGCSAGAPGVLADILAIARARRGR